MALSPVALSGTGGDTPSALALRPQLTTESKGICMYSERFSLTVTRRPLLIRCLAPV